MPTLHDRVYDSGLSVLDSEANQLRVCSQEPATYPQAASTYALATKTSPSIGAPQARAGGGREVVCAAFSDGVVDSTGTATHWALIDTANARLLAAGPLAASQPVTVGNSFSLTAFAIGIPGVEG